MEGKIEMVPTPKIEKESPELRTYRLEKAAIYVSELGRVIERQALERLIENPTYEGLRRLNF